MKLKDTCSLEKSYDQPRQHIKRQRHYFANKDPSSQRYGFSSSHVWMWELNYKESWTRKNWCFELWCWRLLELPWTVRRSNQSLLNEISSEYSLEGLMLKLNLQYKWNQFWIFIGRTDAEAESPILWPAGVKSQLIWKDLDGGKDWRQEEKGTTEDEMVGWHHWLNGHEFE